MDDAPRPGEEITIGDTLIRLEPPDVFYMNIGGVPPMDEAVRIMDLMARFAEGKSAIFCINNVTRSKGFPPEARKLVADRMSELPIRASAVAGASFQMRVLITLVFKVRSLFGPEAPLETRFFATEDEARAWIETKKSQV